MKKVFALSAFLVLMSSAFAQKKFTVNGVVVDKNTQQPLGGASIFIPDLRLGIIADSLGRFSKQMTAGGHLLEISHVNYATSSQSVFLNKDMALKIEMKEAVLENASVVVTGTTRATSLRNLPVQVDILRKDDLQAHAGANMIDALTQKPGIQSITTGPGVSKPVIRGLGYNRVLSIVDGIRQEGQQWGDEHGIEIDENSVQRVEILKGPSSIMYGSDAMAGVINFIRTTTITPGTLRALAGYKFSSNSRSHLAYFSNTVNNNGFQWNVNGSWKNAANYRNKYDGLVFNSGFSEKNIGGYAGLNRQWGNLNLVASSYHLKTGMIEGLRDSAGNFIKETADSTIVLNDAMLKKRTIDVPFQNISHTKAALSGNIAIHDMKVGINLGVQQNDRREYGDPANAESPTLAMKLTTLTQAVQFHLREKDHFSPAIGLSSMFQKNRNGAVEQLIPDYSMQDFGTFFYGQQQWQRLSASGGLRYDLRRIRTSPLMDGTEVKEQNLDKNFSDVSASIGFSYKALPDLNLKLNVAKAFRAPSVSELASNGAHEGTNRYEFGNPDLKSERSMQYDASAEWSTGHMLLSVAAYYNDFSNFIYYNRLGDSVVRVDDQYLNAFKFNGQAASLRGVEISLDLHPHPVDWLHIENSFSFVRGTFKKQIGVSRNIPFIPAAKLSNELRANLPDKPRMKKAYVRLNADHFFAQNHAFTSFDTETATPGYSLFDLGAGAEIFISKKQSINLSLMVQNLTNRAYQSHLNRLKYTDVNESTGRQGVFNPGRNFVIRLEIPLEIRLKTSGQ